ncbi:MAG TPA: Ig-like domain-containing protein [Lachnospiraceae bacterium]|nr:Ig-like domain-containing protein [Lachnospiraceae bacterium]
MSFFKRILLSILLCITIIFISPAFYTTTAKADSIEFVILSQYKANVNIGEEFYILAITTNGDMPSWKSSSSRIASVDTYGKVTAKSAGTAKVTAKIKNGEASCKVTVNKTTLTISDTSVSIERGETYQLTASTSNHSFVTWKSSKKSVATIDENGNITGVKPGESTITAKADGTTKTCNLKVKAPTVKLSNTKVKLYRGQTTKLSATVSSLVPPTWKTNKKSVATVDETGTITAMKHGTAVITATVDGVSRSCEVTVEAPEITLSADELSIVAGSATSLTANVSSGNSVLWSSSNDTIASVDADGVVTGWQKGKAYIYAAEDGTKVRCRITVTEITTK